MMEMRGIVLFSPMLILSKLQKIIVREDDALTNDLLESQA